MSDAPEGKPKRKPRAPAPPIRFEVVSIGAPGPVAVLRAQMFALDLPLPRIDAAAARLRMELADKKDEAA